MVIYLLNFLAKQIAWLAEWSKAVGLRSSGTLYRVGSNPTSRMNLFDSVSSVESFSCGVAFRGSVYFIQESSNEIMHSGF
jgi:hypothetical protein